MTTERAWTGPLAEAGYPLGLLQATRLGTSSPKIRVKKEITRVMRLTDTDCTASRGRALKPRPSTSQAVMRLAKFSAAKAAPRKPAR